MSGSPPCDPVSDRAQFLFRVAWLQCIRRVMITGHTTASLIPAAACPASRPADGHGFCGADNHTASLCALLGYRPPVAAAHTGKGGGRALHTSPQAAGKNCLSGLRGTRQMIRDSPPSVSMPCSVLTSPLLADFSPSFCRFHQICPVSFGTQKRANCRNR